MITRGTTPTLNFNLNIDISTADAITVVFSQNEEVKLEKELTNSNILSYSTGGLSIPLSKDDTYSLESDIICNIQIVIKFQNGNIISSKIMQTDIEDLLEDSF